MQFRRQPRKLPTVLSVKEVADLLPVASGLRQHLARRRAAAAQLRATGLPPRGVQNLSQF